MTLSPWVAVDAATIPAMRARELRDAWEDFVDGRPPGDSEGAGTPQVRVPIVDSWMRSRDAGVDPSGRQAGAVGARAATGARALWDSHPLARAGGLIEECMATASVEADQLTRRQRRRRAAAQHPRRRAAAQPRRRRHELRRGRAVERGRRRARTRSAPRWRPSTPSRCSRPSTSPSRCSAGHARPRRCTTLRRASCSGSSTSPATSSASTRPACRSWSRPPRRSRRCCGAGCASATTSCARATARCSAPRPRGAALVTGTGRVLLDPQAALVASATSPSIPSGGGMLLLPSGDRGGRRAGRATRTSTSCARGRRRRAARPARVLLELRAARRRRAGRCSSTASRCTCARATSSCWRC